ncbi:MAG: extracellular solute-binding protein [Defluviitaleaceae bacterium]|nr:extracellular solute-binding protein [Defluviitaleaceae bacterium]
MKKLFILFVILPLFLTACGRTGSDAEIINNDDLHSYAENNTLNLAIFEGGYGREFWEDAARRFEAANPGITVNLEIGMDIERIAPQIARGEIPDFMSVEMIGIFAMMLENREFLPLNDFFENTETLDRPGVLLRDIMVEGILENPQLSPLGDGHLYFAPFHAGVTGLVFNQNLFDQMGWSVPTTWDEFFAMDALLDDPAAFVEINGEMVRRYLFAYQGIHPGYMSTLLWSAIASFGGVDAVRRIENFEENAWDNPEVRAALEILVRLGTGGYMMTGTTNLDHITSQKYMMMGKALFIPNGAWMLNEMAAYPREDGFVFGMAPVPAAREGEPRFMVGFSGGQYVIPKGGANTELAFEFLRFLYTRESVAAFARLAQGTKAVFDAAEIAENYLDINIVNMLRIFEYGEFIQFNWAPIPEGVNVLPNDHVFGHTMTPLMLGHLRIENYIARLEDMSRQVRR